LGGGGWQHWTESAGDQEFFGTEEGNSSEPTPAEAIAILFDQYGDEIFSHVQLMVGSIPDAEDLVQDIFLRALRAWPSFQKRSSARTWLWAITRNVLIDHYRWQSREGQQKEALRSLPQPRRTDLADRLVCSEALASLPWPQRQVFVLRVIQDRPSKETAALLGWPEVRVRVTLYRALKRLRQWWDQGGETGEK
jgi:RNA polymerase sigma-70 factor (ECF subfamily)